MTNPAGTPGAPRSSRIAAPGVPPAGPVRLAVGVLLLLSVLAVSPHAVHGQDPGGAAAGILPGGSGAFIRDGDLELRLLGYAQPLLRAFPHERRRPGAPASFSVRRARLDFMALLGEDHTLFIELDGAPAARTALVEAWLNWALAGDALQVRAGKFIGHFSTENMRSSRSLLTAERYMALNSMFFLPGLDTQTGILLHGTGLAGGRLGYALGVYNGNGTASTNRAEDNEAKEVQMRLTWSPSPELEASVALDWTREEAQRLGLFDLAFNEYAGVPVEGRRVGVGGDVAWTRGTWSVAGEGLAFRFDTPSGPEVDLVGGYIQPAWYAYGDEAHGLQLLLRGEIASLGNGPDDILDTLVGLTLGTNYHPSANARLQVNAVLHYADGPAPLQDFDGARWVPLLLTQLQFKL